MAAITDALAGGPPPGLWGEGGGRMGGRLFGVAQPVAGGQAAAELARLRTENVMLRQGAGLTTAVPVGGAAAAKAAATVPYSAVQPSAPVSSSAAQVIPMSIPMAQTNTTMPALGTMPLGSLGGSSTTTGGGTAILL